MLPFLLYRSIGRLALAKRVTACEVSGRDKNLLGYCSYLDRVHKYREMMPSVRVPIKVSCSNTFSSKALSFACHCDYTKRTEWYQHADGKDDHDHLTSILEHPSS